jgi:UDP-glucose 4-epimerase
MIQGQKIPPWLKSKRVFITGGAGFIGSHLVDRLIRDCDVTVYDNLSSGRKEFLASHFGCRGFSFLQADLLEQEGLCKAMQGHNTVFHLAANPEAREGTRDTELDLRVGTIATYNVLESMRRNSVTSIVFASSGTVYGDAPFIPLPENYGPSLPISLYGASKLACEGLISAFSHLFDIQAWIFRFANIVGGRATHGVIHDFVNKLHHDQKELEILGDGQQEKPYLLVDDCIDGILYGLSHAQAPVNLLNLGCSSTTSVTRIAEILVYEMGLHNVRFHYTGEPRGWRGDVPLVKLDVSRMATLGWRAERSSNEAIREAVRRILRENRCVLAREGG